VMRPFIPCGLPAAGWLIFAVNAKEDESPEHFCIPLIDKIRETAMKNIGVPWYYVTYNALIEERVK
ncbi:MAG: hypothetical protein AAB736_00980, partial [Patescibacteria group bacterium]